jgi:hypothetical protein
MNRICEIVKEFSSSEIKEDIKTKILKIEEKYSIEFNLKSYQHIYNGNDYSYYYYHTNDGKILYLMLKNGNLEHISIKEHEKVLCSKDF